MNHTNRTHKHTRIQISPKCKMTCFIFYVYKLDGPVLPFDIIIPIIFLIHFLIVFFSTLNVLIFCGALFGRTLNGLFCTIFKQKNQPDKTSMYTPLFIPRTHNHTRCYLLLLFISTNPKPPPSTHYVTSKLCFPEYYK